MLDILEPSRSNIEKVASALFEGTLVAIPTETVYGLAANAENEFAVKRIYKVKGRPNNHPVIVHIGSLKYIDKWAIDVPDYAMELANYFWPGPMTLILKRTNLAKNFVTGGQDSVGLRIPRHPVALSIVNKFHDLGGNGLVAPSANKFEAVSPTDANSVLIELGSILDSKKDFVIDGGSSEVGIESTIINCLNTTPRILRQGAITKYHIENCLQTKVEINKSNSGIQFSGNQFRHYAPKAKIFLNKEPQEGDGFLALSSIDTPQGCVRLGTPKTPSEFARILYSTFRKADQLGLKRFIVIPPQGDGIELAILERLEKASR